MTNKNRLLSVTPSSFFYNGMSAALSSLALRFSSMAFNIYISGISGSGAMGLLSLIYSVWGFALTAGCVAGAFSTSRICASEIALNGDIYKSTSMCIRFTSVCGSIVGCVLFLLSDFLGKGVLGDTRCILPLRILSLSLPFISASGSLEGYFNACARTYKTSALRIIEQVLKISLTSAIFFLFLHSDAKEACINIISGSVITEILSFFTLMLCFLQDRKKHFQKTNKLHCKYKSIFSLAFPVTAGAGIRSALISIEHILVPKSLMRYGLTYESALSFFGTLHGMALPVILFCHALPSSFSGLLVPKIAECDAKSNKKEIAYIAKRAYRLSICFSLAVSSFIILSSKILGDILFPGTDTSKYIGILAPLIPIMYIDAVSDSILKGMNHQMFSMKINIIDSVISILCVIFIVPKFGTPAYIFAIYASETFNTCASLSKALSITQYRQPLISFLILPLMCAVICAKITFGFYQALENHLNPVQLIITGAFLFIFFYISFLIITGNSSKEERVWIKNLICLSKRPAGKT